MKVCFQLITFITRREFKRYILLTFIAIVAIAVIIIYQISNKPHQNIKDAFAAQTTANALYNSLTNDSTGAHVFQLHFTNSNGLTQKSFISETTGRWDKSDVLFGFNISRVFQLKKKQQDIFCPRKIFFVNSIQING